MEKPTMSHTHHLQTAKNPLYVENFRLSSRVNWGIWNLICSGDIDVPMNWKRKREKMKREKLETFHGMIYFTYIPTALTAVLRNLASKLFCFLSICKSLWQTRQTDTVKLRMDKLLQQWHFWYFSVYTERSFSPCDSTEKSTETVCFSDFQFPTVNCEC